MLDLRLKACSLAPYVPVFKALSRHAHHPEIEGQSLEDAPLILLSSTRMIRRDRHEVPKSPPRTIKIEKLIQ